MEPRVMFDMPIAGFEIDWQDVSNNTLIIQNPEEGDGRTFWKYLPAYHSGLKAMAVTILTPALLTSDQACILTSLG